MRPYKIYAQCAKSTTPIKPVNESEIQFILSECADRLFERNYNLEDEEEDTVNRYLDTLYSLVCDEWEKEGYLECGDFCIKITDEPVRANRYGYPDITHDDVMAAMNR